MAVESKSRYSPLILACLAATWLVWSSTYLAIKFALISFPPFFQMGSRFMVAGLMLLIWCRWRGTALPTAMQWRNGLVIGGLMLVGGMGMTAYSEKSVASGLIVVFIAVMPAVVALLNRFFGVRATRFELLGMGVGFIGVLMLIRGTAFKASPVGLAAIATGVTSWSLGSVLSQQRFPLAKGAMGYASEMLCGGLLLLIVSWFTHETPQWPPQSLALWSWVYLIVFGSLVAFNAYMVLLDRSSAVLASSYAFVNPVFALLLGIWFGNETVSGFEWLAAVVILLGVALLTIPKARRSASQYAAGRPSGRERV
jgi:drug/metabolite transporter (DMT)-like permease